MNMKKRLGETRKVKNEQIVNELSEKETALHLSRFAIIEIAGMANDFYFNRLEFEKFCKQLCKEQREICQRISITHKETEKRSQLIGNAPEPTFL